MKVRRFARMDGHVVTYIHGNGTVGVMVTFDTDDATADKPEFNEMGKNIAMQVAAMNPEYLSKDDISADELEKMKTIVVESALNTPASLPIRFLTASSKKLFLRKSGAMRISRFTTVLITSRERTLQTLFQKKLMLHLLKSLFLTRLKSLTTRFLQVLFRVVFQSRLRKFAFQNSRSFVLTSLTVRLAVM